MNRLNKIPLEQFLEILEDLYNSGANFIDISSEEAIDNGTVKDVIKITVKPEYLSDDDYEDEQDNITFLSDNDIDDLT